MARIEEPARLHAGLRPDQTLFIGIGAQKAGSTWLYNFVDAQPDSQLAFLKEMHFFNAIGTKRAAARRRRIEKFRRRALHTTAKQPNPGTDDYLKLLDRYDDLLRKNAEDLDTYLEIIAHNASAARILGEVTPAYATLSRERLEWLYTAHSRTRIMFVLRDPVARLWSWARMSAKANGDPSRASAETSMTQFLEEGRRSVDARCNYLRTLDSLDAVVPQDHFHVTFFEHLIKDPRTRKREQHAICDFLGIDRFIPEIAASRPNLGVNLALSLELGRRSFTKLKPQYDYIRDRFGGLPEDWNATVEKYGG